MSEHLARVGQIPEQTSAVQQMQRTNVPAGNARPIKRASGHTPTIALLVSAQ